MPEKPVNLRPVHGSLRTLDPERIALILSAELDIPVGYDFASGLDATVFSVTEVRDYTVEDHLRLLEIIHRESVAAHEAGIAAQAAEVRDELAAAARFQFGWSERPVTEHNLDGQSRSEYKDCPACRKIRAVWNERSPINETAESLERDDLRVTATLEVLRACGVVHTCRDEIQPA